jgi:manganese oxidase
MISRRKMLAGGVALAGGALLTSVRQARAQEINRLDDEPAPPPPEAQHELGYVPVLTPDGATLPWRMIDGFKTWHLVAEPVRRAIGDELVANCWGYNGITPGPTIEAVEGDRVRIYVTNRLPAPTTVHWHGVLLPNGMDGVSGLTQPPIWPGQTFRYEFELRQSGTLMYHPHFDEMSQMAMGMMGFFIVHPRQPAEEQSQEQEPRPQVDRDFAIMLATWFFRPGTTTPDVNEMLDFNVLTFNSRVFPYVEPLVVRLGQRVRIRLGNLGQMDHHPIHLHGHHFWVTGTDGGRIPRSAWWPETTVLVPVGATRDIEFIADAPGDWALHCHMTHHTMNQMGHEVPNMMGVDAKRLDAAVRPLLPAYMTMGHRGMADHFEHEMPRPRHTLPMGGGEGPFGPISMGGMFTVLKVREGIETYEDPGFYVHPPGTVAAAVFPREVPHIVGSYDLDDVPSPEDERIDGPPHHHEH